MMSVHSMSSFLVSKMQMRIKSSLMVIRRNCTFQIQMPTKQIIKKGNLLKLCLRQKINVYKKSLRSFEYVGCSVFVRPR